MSNIFEKLVGGKISKICRVCDMISIEIVFERVEPIYIHVQSFLRILDHQKIIVCSEDIYRCSEKHHAQDFCWDIPGQSVFDEVLKEYIDILSSASILNAYMEPPGDLIICCSGDVCIQILINSVTYEEKYRIFNNSREFVFNG